MSRVALVLLMGLPGSGKSTLCQKLLQLDKEDVKLQYVCYDELLEVNESEKWRNGRDQIIKQVEDIIVKNVDGGEKLLILVDDNFYYQSMRRMYFKMAKRYRVPVCIVFMQCPLELAIARVEERSSKGGLKVEKDVICQMAQKMELPVEHNWENFHIKINSQNYDINFIWKSLLSLIKMASEKQLPEIQSEEPEPANCVASKNTFLQDADIALRKFLSAKMQEAQSRNLPKSEMTILAQQLNSSRKQFLKQLGDPSSMTDLVDQFRQYLLICE